MSTQISTNRNYFQLKLIVLAGLNPGNQNCVSWFGTFQHRQDCVYGFSSLSLATRASRDVKEWFLSKSGEATRQYGYSMSILDHGVDKMFLE